MERVVAGGDDAVFLSQQVAKTGAESYYDSYDYDHRIHENPRPTVIPDGRPSLIGASTLFLEAFGGLQIFHEWSCVDANRQPLPEPQVDSIVIYKNQTLRSALDRLAEASERRLGWQELSGAIWRLPPRGGQHRIESALDTVISFHVESATPWEAMVEVVGQMNASPSLIRPFHVDPVFLGRLEAPEPGLDDGTVLISLNLASVTAREALSIILSKLGLNVHGRYYNHEGGAAILYLIFLDDTGKPLRSYQRLDSEAYDAYFQESRKGELDAEKRLKEAGQAP